MADGRSVPAKVRPRGEEETLLDEGVEVQVFFDAAAQPQDGLGVEL